MLGKRILIALAAVVLALAAVGVLGQVRRQHREAARQAAVERFAAAHPLEVSAASIDLARYNGQVTHFALVPERRPPGIVRMEPTGAQQDGGVTDVYSYGALEAVVNFTGIPGQLPCGDQPCVRDADLTAATSDAPSLRHVAVWLTGPASPEAAEIREFWARTAWVPTAKATWFTDLAERGSPGIRR
jgi:hypothetical protein